MLFRLILAASTALSVLAAAGAQAGEAAAPGQRPAAIRAGGLEEVVVTARRRSEKAQTTPISVTAFTAASLRQQNILQLQDLNNVVPGFRFAQEGGKTTNKITLRGLDRIPLGEGVPAVVTYFADVPLPGFASNIPTFDLGNIQVLKGPQGTLFGRNALGGAVLINPVAPSNKLTGYVDSQVGNLGYYSVEGAINVPIVPDKVELRIGGQIRREDGYVKNLSGGPDFANTDENAYRVSLLIQPTSYIKNTTIYDYFVAPEVSSGQYLYKVNQGVVPGISPLIDPQLESYFAGQKAGGPHSGFADATGAGLSFRRLWGVSNDTRVDITDGLQFHNIVGYRRAFNQQEVNTGATGPLSIDLPGVGTLPFTLLDAGEQDNKEFITEEAQVLGKAFGNHLSWIIGGFFNHDDAPGPAGSNLVTFDIGPPKNAFITSLVTDNNYAIYGQGGLDLSGWLLKGLTLNAGYRYSWDKVSSCSGSFAGYVTSSVCEAAAAQHVIGGPGDVGATGNQPSWTIGLDYKLSPHQFFYITSRRGYRGVNVNTPLLTSPYTTGGVVVPPSLGGPGCTGPGNVCPDLRPFQTTHAEKLTDVEIGSKSEFHVYGMPVRFDIDGFVSKYNGALQFFNVIPTGIYPFAPDLPSHTSLGINAANETISGIETALTVRPFSNLTITLDGAYNNAVINKITAPSTTGLSLTASQITLPSPRFSGSISVNWEPPIHPLRGDVVVSGDYFQTAKFGAQYGVNLPGYGVGNARIALNHIEGTGFSIDAYAKNLFDRAYFTGASVLIPTFPVSSAFYGEPRTYVLEARYDF